MSYLAALAISLNLAIAAAALITATHNLRDGDPWDRIAMPFLIGVLNIWAALLQWIG